MRLSIRTEYALLALVALARQPEGAFTHGGEIAAGQGIPIRFLQQILYALKKARIVRSTKGKSGGYALARRASTISVAEVVRLFDGPLAPSRGVSRFYHEETPILGEKKIVALMREIRDHVAERLERTSIADIT